MQEQNPKQQIVERIKKAATVLVTVNRNPSVDELTAALGLTMMLNKMDKHATAVFSGVLPDAIAFLEPDKLIENNTDSLRDFIIALDKEKADRLRYKVEDDVVRIYITPYKTTISEKDLDFSQGDFNVELVIGVGVQDKNSLDSAITAHGRILHDATVATINTEHGSDLGSINWIDANASSYCEMLMSLSEALQSGILDEQIASSLLTGIVAATDRFSNQRTSPRVMTMAAQLMAAGANQQLIATKLQENHAIAPDEPASGKSDDEFRENTSKKIARGQQASSADDEGSPHEEDVTPQQSKDGEMTISHDKDTAETESDDPVARAQAALDEAMKKTQKSNGSSSQIDLGDDLASQADSYSAPADNEPPVVPELPAPYTPSQPEPPTQPEKGSKQSSDDSVEPTFGGTLSATVTEAEDAKRREEKLNRNHKILSHGGDQSGGGQSPDQPTASGQSASQDYGKTTASEADDIMSYEPTGDASPRASTKGRRIEPTGQSPYQPPVSQPAPNNDILLPEPSQDDASAPDAQTLADLESQIRQVAEPVDGLQDARSAVEQAFAPDAPSAAPAPQPLSQPAQEPSPQPMPSPQAQPMPPLPPMPDFSTLPPMPAPNQPEPHVDTQPQQPMQPGVAPEVEAEPGFPTQPSVDPGQFKIPGQQ